MKQAFRSIAATASGILVAVSLAACGSDGPGGIDSTGEGSTGVFPVTVDHQFGSETFTGTPQRIVDLSSGYALESFLQLGVEPLVSAGLGDPSTTLPWAADRITWSVDDDLNTSSAEKIADLDPDLIITTSTVSQKDWSQLEDIAPTVPVEVDTSKAVWHSYLPVIAEVTGNSDKVDGIEEKFSEQVADLQKSLPGLSELTFNSGALTKGFIYADNLVLKDLGLTLEPVQASKKSGDAISDENIGHLQGDLLVIFDPLGKRAEIENNPLFKELPAVRAGAVVWQDKALGFALSTAPGPSSVDWLIERIRPQLEAAIDAK